jgi:hypothetical protein
MTAWPYSLAELIDAVEAQTAGRVDRAASGVVDVESLVDDHE